MRSYSVEYEKKDEHGEAIFCKLRFNEVVLG